MPVVRSNKRSRAQRTLPYTKKRVPMSKFYSAEYQAKILKQIARRELYKNVETKQSNYTNTDGVEIFHNNQVRVEDALLKTSPGPYDPTTTSAENRIGDQVNCRGVSIKMMLEMNERFTDVTFRILVVKSAKGDLPDRATLFNGLSGNKMLDTINTERYTILASKYVHMKSSGQSQIGAATEPGIGNYSGTQLTSRATRIVKMWIPGNKFGRRGLIQYEQGSSQPKFFDYTVLVFAYSNYSTSQDLYYVGRVNDYVKVMYYKDA